MNLRGDPDCLSRMFGGQFDPGLLWYLQGAVLSPLESCPRAVLCT